MNTSYVLVGLVVFIVVLLLWIGYGGLGFLLIGLIKLAVVILIIWLWEREPKKKEW